MSDTGAHDGPGDDPNDATPDPAAMDMVTADGKTGGRTSSGSSELQLTIQSLDRNMSVGSSIVLYLEDDFQQPDSIPASSVYLVAEGGSATQQRTTGRGARVYVTTAPRIKTSDYFTKDKKDIAIRVLVPDMCTNATDECEGPNGLYSGQKVSLVIESNSGIKNPPEAGTHSTGYTLLGPTGEIPGRGNFTVLNVIATVAKITLSDVDNKRGYEMTVAGTGFNNGTSAGVYVIGGKAAVWDTLDCAAMNLAAGSSDTMGSGFCRMYAMLTDAEKATVQGLDFTTGPAEAAACEGIIREGTQVGGALVGSDDKVSVVFEVTVPTFKPGNVNYLCMGDGEGRMSDTDVEDFNLQPSIKVVPDTANAGDTVNVFAQDYPNEDQGFTLLKIANELIGRSFIKSSRQIGEDGSGTVTFEVPGGYEGVLRIDALWGGDENGNNKCDSGESTCIDEFTKITLGGAELNVSKTAALPNDTVIVNGNGFGSQTCIDPADIRLTEVQVRVHRDSLADGGACNNMVEVSNSGQFVATVFLWPMDDSDSGTNPTLIAGTHEFSVEDSEDYSASINITIAEPTVWITPDIAGPRDYVTITGENWAVDNPDNPLSVSVMINVQDLDNRGRSYPVYPDAVGRVTAEHRVHRDVAIPSTVQVRASYGDVVKIGSFAVPASTIEVTPGEGQPGDFISLSATNMPVYNEVDYIEVGGTRYDDPGVNTDRDGNVTVEDVLIPGLDPGVYSVVISVGDASNRTIAIGEVNVLAESSARGAPAELPGATESLGDSLVAIFHFDDVGKVWTFYDPRPDFAELNTLTEMVNGEAYWILVSETVEDVLLNNKNRSLTCRGTDCWNLEVW